MIDWVFCNNCSLKFHDKVKFYLSECGHIFCQKCIEKMKQTKKCVICNKSASVMELSTNMDLTTQLYFWPIEKMLQQSLQVNHFQEMHKNLFLQSLNRKYTYVKRECVNYYNANKKLQKENQLMREMLRSAGYSPPSNLITSTPANNTKGTYEDISMLSSIRITPTNRYQRKKKDASSILSSIHGLSSAQMVPKGYAVPVRREMTTQNPATVTPDFMEKVRGNRGYPSLKMDVSSIHSSTHGPSPSQMVPMGYPVPVHTMQNPAAATPNFMEKLRGKPGYPSLGYPRK